ncbi:hypothetical protein FJZ31_37910 [Candidatus Poribacteria bacterium]|nr:hypothetical protein [Candidatus Poribacteria bacterium]
MPNPYIVGTAVIGNQFYGRETLINQVLTGNRDCFCLMGNRRIGKTSFLRHLEFLVKEKYPHFIGVYWDLQGCRMEEDLAEQLKNGLLDAEEQLEAAGIDYDKLEESQNLFSLFRLLKRRLIRLPKKLLLLVDEAESLIEVGENDKGLLGKLRSVMQDSTFTRTIVSGSRRLSEVSRVELAGSDFLDGFEPVLFIGSLDEADADALIAQSQLGQGLQIPGDVAAEIKEKTSCHPYLLQSICLYLYDHEMDSPLWKRGVGGDLSKVYDYVMQQGMADKAFADDFRYLAPIEKDILMQIYRLGSANLSQIQQQIYLDADTIKQFLFILEACGYIKPEGENYSIANYFFARWLKSNEARLDEIASVVSDAAMRDIEAQPVTHYLTEAIAVVDLYGSSPLANRYGANFLLELLGMLREIIQPLYRAHNGQFFRSKGDDFLMTFPTAQDAVEVVIEVLKQVERYNEQPKAGVPIELHIGIHFGETRVGWENDRYGDAVNRAFRVASIQPADMIEMEGGVTRTELPTKNAILITENVYELIKEAAWLQYRLIGLFKLRGITERHLIYQVLRKDE